MNSCVWSWKLCTGVTWIMRACRCPTSKQKVSHAVWRLFWLFWLFFDAVLLQSCCHYCAERSQATEQRYNKLKEKHTELVASHAELLRKVWTDWDVCFKWDLSQWTSVVTVINVLTECRHGEDAVGHAADSGWGGEDQTAAVLWDWSCKAGIWYEGWCSVLSFYIRAMLQAYVTVRFVAAVAGGAKVWNGETEKRAGGEDGWSDKNQGKPAEQREGDLSTQDGLLYFITSVLWGVRLPLSARCRSRRTAQWQLCRQRRSDLCGLWARRKQSCRLCGRRRKCSSHHFSRSERKTPGSSESFRASWRTRSAATPSSALAVSPA